MIGPSAGSLSTESDENARPESSGTGMLSRARASRIPRPHSGWSPAQAANVVMNTSEVTRRPARVGSSWVGMSDAPIELPQGRAARIASDADHAMQRHRGRV